MFGENLLRLARIACSAQGMVPLVLPVGGFQRQPLSALNIYSTLGLFFLTPLQRLYCIIVPAWTCKILHNSQKKVHLASSRAPLPQGVLALPTTMSSQIYGEPYVEATSNASNESGYASGASTSSSQESLPDIHFTKPHLKFLNRRLAQLEPQGTCRLT